MRLELLSHEDIKNVTDSMISYEDKGLVWLAYFMGPKLNPEDYLNLDLGDVRHDDTLIIRNSFGNVEEETSYDYPAVIKQEVQLAKILRLASRETEWHYKNGHDGLIVKLPAGDQVFKSLMVIDKSVQERIRDIGLLNGLEDYFTIEHLHNSYKMLVQKKS
jgi:hypothetical protein